MEFDLEKSVMRVYDAQDNRWKAYDFMDVDLAVGNAEEESGDTIVGRARKFWTDLADKELNEMEAQGIVMKP